MECERRNLPLLGVAVLAAVALLGSTAVLKLTELTTPLRIAVAFLPLPFYVALFIMAVRVTRRLDELKQRIALEALAFAVIGMLLSTLCYGLLVRAGGPGQEIRVIEPYLIEVTREGPGHGLPRPVSRREAIRAQGPTVRTDPV